MPKKGTIVLVPFPFTDLSGVKVRPAIVISTVAMGKDVVVVFISSKKEVKIRKCDLAVSPSSANGLKVDSVVKCGKIATLEKRIILGELGTLESSVMIEVDKKLKLVLGV
ncbi:MAG: type II toxin-antitoxin system PemK/MazF family toxin [bacterium]|nr:type II toxin-antitoxin system PemK/MazF family toxin [bacterium]